jgi:HK97 family phage prohead protease
MMNKKFEINSLFEVVQKDAKSDVLTIKGYANTVSKDRTGDVIVKEAWMQGGMDDYLKNPIILAFHDYARPVGTTVDYNVTDKGLEIVAEISKAAGEVYNLIKDGVLKTFSVGFSIKDADYDKEQDTFFIKDLSLYEISVVSVPANQDSTFSLAKSFTDVDEYKSFRKTFEKEVEEVKEDITKGEKEPSQDNILKEINMDKKELQEMMAKSATAALDSYKTEVAEKDAKAVAEANLKAIEVGKTQAEKTAEALETKIKADGDSYSKAISEMSDELAAAKTEMAAMQTSKMQFSEAGGNAPTKDELTNVFITSKILGKSIDQTEVGKQLIEKASANRINSDDANWETTWNANMFTEMQNRVVVESVFNTMQMNARIMHFPSNPDSGADATWVDASNQNTFNDGTEIGTAFNDLSSGAIAKHLLRDVPLTAFKLATREYVGYEEEEDTLLPIAGIVSDAIVRRMARTSDKSILGTGIAAPFTELEEFSGGHTGGTVSSASTTATITSTNVHSARTAMGQWGHNPSDLVLFLSQAAYYGLVDDANVITSDKYGEKATILTGELGKIWGIPMIVSDAFEAAAAGKAQGILVNPSNYIVGNYRNLTVQTADDVVAQSKAIVATRRMGFIAKDTNGASATQGSMCLLKYAAS